MGNCFPSKGDACLNYKTCFVVGEKFQNDNNPFERHTVIAKTEKFAEDLYYKTTEKFRCLSFSLNTHAPAR